MRSVQSALNLLDFDHRTGNCIGSTMELVVIRSRGTSWHRVMQPLPTPLPLPTTQSPPPTPNLNPRPNIMDPQGRAFSSPPPPSPPPPTRRLRLPSRRSRRPKSSSRPSPRAPPIDSIQPFEVERFSRRTKEVEFGAFGGKNVNWRICHNTRHMFAATK